MDPTQKPHASFHISLCMLGWADCLFVGGGHTGWLAGSLFPNQELNLGL